MNRIINYSNQVLIRDTFMSSIFLAGPTNRDGKRTQWRIDALELLKDFEGIIYVPEYLNEPFNISKINKQCEWEYGAMHHADCIMFWIPRNIKNGMPAFTTNVEFGLYLNAKPHSVVYGRPNDSEKNTYLDWLYRQIKHDNNQTYKIFNNLKDLIVSARDIAYRAYLQRLKII